MLFIISVDSYSRIAHCRQVGSWRVDNSEISLLICDLDLFHSQGLLSSRWWRLIYRFKISHTCILKFDSFSPSVFFCTKLFQNATAVSLKSVFFNIYTAFERTGFHYWFSTFNFYRVILTLFEKVFSPFIFVRYFFYLPAESLPRPISSIFTRSSSQTFLQTSRLVELVTSIKMELVSLDI